MKTSFAFLCFLCCMGIMTTGCKKDRHDIYPTKTIKVNIAKDAAYFYDLGWFWEKENASISRQAMHSESSWIYNIGSGGRLAFEYIPAKNYTGSDLVEIKCDRLPDGTNSNPNISYIIFEFYISE